MTKVPKVSEEAIAEAYKKLESVMKHSAKTNNYEQMEKVLKESNDNFVKNQPEIHKFVGSVMKLHLTATQGTLLAPQLALYVMVIMNSLYVQQEMDDVGGLFDFGEGK